MNTYSKILILTFTLLSAKVFAQDTEVVNFTVVFESVLNLNVTGGADQTATFNSPAIYNLGIDAVGSNGINQ